MHKFRIYPVLSTFSLGIILLLSLTLLTPVLAALSKPLLMSGKTALYQRVLALPDATIHDDPAVGSASKAVVPFTIFYVYKRETVAEQAWIQVGSDSHGTRVGWIKADAMVDWNQGLTVSFRNPKNHDRVLLFRDRDSLHELTQAENLDNYQQLYSSAVAGKTSVDSPVVAISPATDIDIFKNFYLIPIHQHEDVFLGAEKATMLQVASVPLSQSAEKKGDGEISAEIPDLTAGVVFVIDTTLSMEPYIQRTRQAVRNIYRQLTRDKKTGLKFGLVAYRDNVDAAPGLEYLVKTYATLEQGATEKGFFSRVNQVKAATESSQDFVEDAYSGIRMALESIDWESVQARYMILITDAGARSKNDPLGSAEMDTDRLQKIAQEKGIAISVLHLLTKSGAENHADAAAQYKALSLHPDVGELYYGVKTGEVGDFGQALDALAGQVKNLVQGVVASHSDSHNSTELSVLEGKFEKLGHALRMQYLATDGKNQLPQTFNAWMLDRDFRNPERSPLEVRVLLTRDQLSELHDVMRRVLSTFEEGLLSPRNFLNDLKSLAATLSRDPQQLGKATRTGGVANLADMGFMQEYIEGLPYQGETMKISFEDWEDWPASRQLEFIHGLEEKIGYYQALHDHVDLWVSLDGGPVSGNSVFPLALEMLP